MATKKKQKTIVRGYKIFNSNFTCRGFQFQEGKEYKHKGDLLVCNSGFHFCLKAAHCFSYYSFTPENIVCEVEALGEVQYHGDDSKACTDHIRIVRRLEWSEVLVVSNEGKNNSGHSNSGYRNSGYRNSGDRNSGSWNSGDSNSGSWNSGDSNSGYSNSGDSNSGYRNSGDRNSGYRNSGSWNSGYSNSGSWNSGSWNSGDRNSGDSNSGYRNSGAFCLDKNPRIFLFDKIANMTVKEWEQSRACQLMSALDPCIWVPSSIMTEQEKATNPKWETTEGYLKTISLKDAWKNMWGNLSESDKALFSALPNFDAEIFFQITGIDLR